MVASSSVGQLFEDESEDDFDFDFEGEFQLEGAVEHEHEAEFEAEFEGEFEFDGESELEGAAQLELQRPATAGSTTATVGAPIVPVRMGRHPRLLVTIAGLAVVAVIVAMLTQGKLPSHRGPVGRAATGPAAQAASWAHRSLPSGARLIADGSMYNNLVEQGFAPTSLLDSGGVGDLTGSAATGFIVSTPVVRAVGTSSESAIGRILAGSMMLAQFGTGPNSVQIRQVQPTGTAFADAATRTMAGTSLLHNPRFAATPAVADVMAAGRLDLRIATLLAVLTSQESIRLTGLTQDPAEALAGAPARTAQLALPVGDDGRLQSVIATMPEAERPSSTTRNSSGEVVLQWPPDLAVPLPAS